MTKLLYELFAITLLHFLKISCGTKINCKPTKTSHTSDIQSKVLTSDFKPMKCNFDTDLTYSLKGFLVTNECEPVANYSVELLMPDSKGNYYSKCLVKSTNQGFYIFHFDNFEDEDKVTLYLKIHYGNENIAIYDLHFRGLHNIIKNITLDGQHEHVNNKIERNISKRAAVALNELLDDNGKLLHSKIHSSADGSVWINTPNLKRSHDENPFEWMKQNSWIEGAVPYFKRNYDSFDKKKYENFLANRRSWKDADIQWIKKRQSGYQSVDGALHHSILKRSVSPLESKSDVSELNLKQSVDKNNDDFKKSIKHSRNLLHTNGNNYFHPGNNWKINKIDNLNDIIHDNSIDEKLPKRAWGQSGMSWIKKSSNYDNSDLGKRAWGQSGMSWVKKDQPFSPKKKAWGQSGMSWVKKNSNTNEKDDINNTKIHSRVSKRDVQASLNRSDFKKMWAQSRMNWLKRDLESTIDDHHDKRVWGKSGMTWVKRGKDEPEGNRMEENDMNKRAWGQSGMSWVKKDMNSLPIAHENNQDKRAWGQSGMSWVKRELDNDWSNDDDKRAWGQSGMSWIKKRKMDTLSEDPNKRAWGQSGMSWVKKNLEDALLDSGDKRAWGQSGMSWVKKRLENDAGNVNDLNPNQLDMSLVENNLNSFGKDDEKRAWGQSGMSWVKKNSEDEPSDNENKRAWGQSGMSWVKKNSDSVPYDDANKRAWGQSGMSWIKRNLLNHIEEDPDKRAWGQSGMSWVKKDAPVDINNDENKRAWGQSGMSWIKRGSADKYDDDDKYKRAWGQSGMSWVKKKSKDLYKDELDKKAWGQSGMSWVKRNLYDIYGINEQDTPHS